MGTALHLAAKDLRQRLRDRSALLVGVIVPLGLAFILNLVFGSGGPQQPFRYALVDLDGGPVASAFTTGVLGDLAERKVLTVRRAATAAEATRLVELGTVDAAFVLPSGLSGAGAARIDVLGTVDAPTATEVANAVATSFVTDLNGATVAAAAAAGSAPTTPAGSDPTAHAGPGIAAADPAALAEAARRAAALPQPLSLVDASTRTKILDSATYLAAGMAVFFLFFTVQFGVASLVEERSAGTLYRLLALPVRPSSIMLGKLLTSLVLGVVSMTVLIVATSLFMGASFGSPAGVAVLVVAAVFAATGVTALIGGLARTAEQAGGWQSVISTLLGLLGGTFFPIAQVSGFGSISLITPHAWFLRGLAELADGGGVADALPAAGAMLLFAAVCGGIGFARLRRVVTP